MVDAAWLLPDTYPLKAEFNADVENSLADWNAKYTNNPNANPLYFNDDAVMANLNGGTLNGLSPWQHNFLVWSVNHAAELGFSGATPFRNWLAKFEIGLMTDWQSNPTQGYCWLEASAYQIQVKDASGNWLPSFSAVYQTNFPTLAGLTCNSPAMVTAMGKLEGQSWQAGQMHGYASSATGFPSNLQIGLAAIADSGLPNAADAWTIFDSRSVKPSGTDAYDNNPNFAVVPRSVSQTSNPVPPPTNPIPPPTNTTAPIVATPPGLLAPMDHPPLPPPDTTGSTVTAASSPTAKPAPTAVKPSTPTGSRSRGILPSTGTIYRDINRAFRPTFRAVRYFLTSWFEPWVPRSAQPATTRAAAAPAARVAGSRITPTAASAPNARANLAIPAASGPIPRNSPDNCPRCSGVIDRR
jgi:hypothetical protein